MISQELFNNTGELIMNNDSIFNIRHGIHQNELFADKFAFLIDINGDDAKRSYKKLKHLNKSNCIHRIRHKDGKPKKLDRFFKRFYDCKLKSKGKTRKFIISAIPNEKMSGIRRAHLRFEFNPNGMNATTLVALSRLIEDIVGEDVFLILHRITRVSKIHIAYDIPYFSHENIMILKKYARTFKVIRKHHAIKTIVMGSSTSQCHSIFYDKLEEIVARGYNTPDDGSSLLRLEGQFKPYCGLNQLYSLRNVFDDFSFYRRALNPDEFDPEFMLRLMDKDLMGAFRDAQHRGIDYTKQLEKYRMRLFDSTEIWNTYKSKLDFINMLFPYLHEPLTKSQKTFSNIRTSPITYSGS